MTNWPSHDGAQVETFAADTSGSLGASVSNLTALNTKGAYVELIASTSFAYSGMRFEFCQSNGVTAYGPILADLAIGASGSEKIIAENLFHDTWRGSQFSNNLLLPISVPSGSRLSARFQSGGNTSAGLTISATGFTTGFASPFFAGHSRLITMGANTADSGGVSIDPGGTANTKGSWTEVVASTSVSLAYLYMIIGEQQNPALDEFFDWLFDIAIGASGSEKVLVNNLWHHERGLEYGDGYVHGPLPVSIPAGSRLAVRSQCSRTDATDRLRDVVLYGVAA